MAGIARRVYRLGDATSGVMINAISNLLRSQTTNTLKEPSKSGSFSVHRACR